MHLSRDEQFNAIAAELGYSFEGEIKIGGNYTPALRHAEYVYISGQVPRVGSDIVVCGRVGDETSLVQAQLAAKICVMRCLALLRNSLGSLDKVTGILRMTVFTQSAADFTQQSEVGDAASEILYQLFGQAGVHTRTSVGVYQLPKNASVEIDMIAIAS